MDGYSKARIKRKVHENRLLSALNRVRVNTRDSWHRNAVNKRGASTALRVIAALEAEGFEPVLTAGTLLGAIRDGKVLPHDLDLDIALRVDENSEWTRIRRILEQAGYPIIRQFSFAGNIREQTYHARGFDFDIFGFHHVDAPGMVRAYYFCRIDGIEYRHDDERSVMYHDIPDYTERCLINMSGVELPVPNNASDILEALYGPEWPVPNPSWVSGTGWTLAEGVIERRVVYPRHLPHRLPC